MISILATATVLSAGLVAVLLSNQPKPKRLPVRARNGRRPNA